jgi:GTP-binding protein HflX
VHVLDITHPQVLRQAEAVYTTLEDIGALGTPIINALNKIDRLPPFGDISALLAAFPDSVMISARTGAGLEALLARVEETLEEQMIWLEVLIPYESGGLVDLFHRRGFIEREEHTGEGTHIVGRIPRALKGDFWSYQARRERG